MDRHEEIRKMILNVLKEGPMPGNVLIKKILENNKYTSYYKPDDIGYALYLSYTEGYIERFEENGVICYRINESRVEKRN